MLFMMKILNIPMRSPTINRGATRTGSTAAKTRFHNVLFPVFFVLPSLLTAGYTALSLYAATRLAYAPQRPLLSTPAELDLLYPVGMNGTTFSRLRLRFLHGFTHSRSYLIREMLYLLT